jgi:hypothetical protein
MHLEDRSETIDRTSTWPIVLIGLILAVCLKIL